MIITDFTNIIATIGSSSIISSAITYLFAKRKYRNEADSTEIDNLKKSIEVYQTIIDDLKERIQDIKNEVNVMKTEFNIKLKQAKEKCK
jgi:galactitol-specific phosphotransferase system IIB component